MELPVVSLRRYPVKSMAGEDLPAATFDRRGMDGDRWFAVVDEEGGLTSVKNSRRFRRRDGITDFAARTDGSGVLVSVADEGGDLAWPAGDPSLDAELTRRLGAPLRVVAERTVSHFDAAPVSLVGSASLRWCAEELGIEVDPRRLRVNVVVETDTPFVEEGWVGRHLRCGELDLVVSERVPRCRMVNLAQDGLAEPARLLQALGEHRETCLAMYALVDRPGTLRAGDVLTLT